VSCSFPLGTTPKKATKSNIHFPYLYKDLNMTFENYAMYSIKPHRRTCACTYEKYENYTKMQMWQEISCPKHGVMTQHTAKGSSNLAMFTAKQVHSTSWQQHKRKRNYSLSHSILCDFAASSRDVCTCSQNIAWTRQWSVIQHHHKPSIFYTPPFVKSCADHITMHYRVLTYSRVNSGEGCVCPSAISF
jgi:hypothetical protein